MVKVASTLGCRVHTKETGMLFITPEHKRRKFISEAVILYMQGDLRWYRFLSDRIKNGIAANPNNKYQVILKWIMSAEAENATVVKSWIKFKYDKGTTQKAD
jgi:hypothetical protein